ncbi:MAG: hypothetical protein A3F68_01775 [Acidobacteria bacterium RIFCSPLOWO2_12_FULL_54_10]|nr:MAG: hypothetical protein A3F68_01775 [Acidobacteria bacterium RIFCSPLOWO2_12_FULL_54_10]
MRSVTFSKASLLLACLGAAFLPPAVAQTPQPVATVSGTPIYEEDLVPRIQSQLLQLKNQEYDLKSRALESVINEKLVIAAAMEKGITVEKLLDEVDASVPEPTNEELQSAYDAQKEQIKRPLEEVKDQLRTLIKQSKAQDTRQAYFDSLRKQAKINISLKPPKVEVSYDPARVRGNPQAPITIVEFSDFQCPFCLNVYKTIQGLLKKYDGQIKLAYRDFPLRQIHPEAQKSAEASRCAGEQGKFWEYHDLLFENPKDLKSPALIMRAATIDLDTEQFEVCLNSNKFTTSVEEDLQAGMKAGVSGTPAFFINGFSISGAQPSAAFEKLIDAELSKPVASASAP